MATSALVLIPDAHLREQRRQLFILLGRELVSDDFTLDQDGTLHFTISEQK